MPIVRRLRARWLALPLLSMLGTVACAPWGQSHYRALRRDLANRQFAAGLSRVEQARRPLYGDKAELLYWLDRAVLTAAAGHHQLSVAAYEAAKGVQQRLYTQHVTDHAAALLLGERKLPYSAEPFEQVAWHLLEADAYLAEGTVSEAAVELRQMQATLDRCHRAAAVSKSVYADDAAGRWLAGLLREADKRELGHLSEARIDLERALSLYETVDAQAFATAVPAGLRRALARVTHGLGLGLKSANRLPLAPEPSAEQARAVLLFYDGLAPHKEEAFWLAFLPNQLIRVAYPIFVPDGRPRARAVLQDVQRGGWAAAELASNFAEKARVDLSERMDGIHDRAVARAIAKYVASEALMAGGAIGGGGAGAALELAGLGLSIAGAVTEHTDVRSWQTLPARLSVAELLLPAGPYDLAVVVDGQSEPVARFTGSLAAGEVAFVSARAY